MMFPLLAVHEEKKKAAETDLLRFILPASVVLHVVIAVVMPATKKSALRRLPPSVVVLETVQEPPPPPVPTTPKKEEPLPEKKAAPVMTTAAHLQPQPQPQTLAPQPTNDAPLDFTGMTLSNDGPGLAVNVGPVATAVPSATAPPTVKTSTAPAPAPLVAPSALARPPRAANLDLELERNYPADAKAAGISGRAVLRVELLSDGRVGKVERLEESYPGFGSACERTVRGGRWEAPLDKEGHAVRTEIKYVCRFEVRS